MEETRKLAHVVMVGGIDPIPGYDRVELATVLGWTVMVRKDQFKPYDLGIYIEIDSLVPATETFKFMEKYNYKVKTQKFCKGTVLSQGLLMSPEDFGGEIVYRPDDSRAIKIGEEEYGIGADMTKALGITYYSADDRKRKKPSINKYEAMALRHKKLFKHQPFKWLMERDWGKKLLFKFYGKKKDKKRGWPEWVTKTDEPRLQNCISILADKTTKWFATEKIDGTSTTFTMRRIKNLLLTEYDFRVCSRNVSFADPERGCFYDTNVYWQMAKKYDIERKLREMLDKHPELEFITIQGETYGNKIQARKYIDGIDFMAFNLIYGYPDGNRIRFNPVIMTEKLKQYDIPCVPVVGQNLTLPDTVKEVMAYVDGDPSVIDGGMREGIVFRNKDATRSFKAVSNEYLIKYHNGDSDYLESLMNIDEDDTDEEDTE